MKFVVTQVQGGVDGFKWLEIDVHALFLAVIRENGPTIQHQSIIRDSIVELKLLLRRGDCTQDGKSNGNNP